MREKRVDVEVEFEFYPAQKRRLFFDDLFEAVGP